MRLCERVSQRDVALKVDIGFLALAESHGHQEESFLLCRMPHTSPEAYGQHAHEVRSHSKFLPV